MHSTLLAVLVAFCCFIAGGNAQRCYSCLSYSTNNPAIPQIGTNCSDTQFGQTKDCSLLGGCAKLEFSLDLAINGVGDVSADYYIRDCGADVNQCLDNNAFQRVLNSQGSIFASMIQTTGVTVISGQSRSICYCTGNLCNHAPSVRVSLGVLLFAMLLPLLMKLFTD